MSGCVVRIRRLTDRIEITLGSGFTNEDLCLVKSLPGRRWNPDQKVWAVPDPDAALRILSEHFGSGRLQVTGHADAPSPEGSPGRHPGTPDRRSGILERVGQGLLLRAYSARTRKVYLDHLRRFIEWCDTSVAELPSGPANSRRSEETSRSAESRLSEGRLEALGDTEAEDLIQRYLVHLAARRNASRSYHNQAVSALRFLFETVLERPRLAVRIPRPRKRPRLPEVLSPNEVARLLAKPRNLKHRALLVLLYSAGLRVSEVVRLRPQDMDEDRGLRGSHGRRGARAEGEAGPGTEGGVGHLYRAWRRRAAHPPPTSPTTSRSRPPRAPDSRPSPPRDRAPSRPRPTESPSPQPGR